MRKQLEPVAPRIRRVEAADAGERVVPLDVLARAFEPRREIVELLGGHPERGMRLAGRGERLLDAYVELVAAAEREPDASSGAQRLRLLELLQAEQVAEEAPRLGLAARQCRELDVI